MAMVGEGNCSACRDLAAELRANSEALRSLRDEEFPPLRVQVRRRTLVFPWIAIAAALSLAVALPISRRTPVEPAHPEPLTPARQSEPLKVKILTSNPNVVIYWSIEPSKGDL